MAIPIKKQVMLDGRPVRVLGRGLHAKRGVRLTLRGLRTGYGKTQAEIAASTGIHQADLSRLEAKADLSDIAISTLARYIEALGGKLELTAVFGNRKAIVVGKEPDQPDR